MTNTPAARLELAHFLDACAARPLRRHALPPAELLREYDDDLAGLIDQADRAHTLASVAASEYQALQPGGATFLDTLAGGDEDAIVQLVTWVPARAFARAVIAQQRAGAADDAARAYAKGAAGLRARLDQAADGVRDAIRRLWEQARDRKDRRALEDGHATADQWRQVKRLWEWVCDPDRAYRPPDHAGTFPAELQLLEWEAHGAVTGTPRMEVPVEALELKGAPPSDVIDTRTRRGLFGR